MSRENVEFVRRCLELWGSRRWELIPEFFDPEIEIDLSRNVFNPDVYRGYSGVERYVQAVEEMWDDFRVVPREYLEGDDKVLVAVTLQGTGKESGVEVTMEIFNIWTIRDSRITRIVGGYRDRAEALAAAGLSERN